MKPRLIRRGGLWHCGILDRRLDDGRLLMKGQLGVGYKPADAFHDWRKLNKLGWFG